MQVNNTQISFQARLSLKDSGNCLSCSQKAKLKQLAKQVGEDTDRIFIGTRKYDNIDSITNKHFKRSDGIVLSLVDNKVVDMRFDDKNIFENIADYLTNFSNEGHNYYQIKPYNISDAISNLKYQINEFCSLKRTYHKTSFGEIIKNIFNPKQNPQNSAKKVNEEEKFQNWLQQERFKKETEEDVDLLNGFYDTFIGPIKEELYG